MTTPRGTGRPRHRSARHGEHRRGDSLIDLHGAVWSWPRVAGNALEYRLVGLPVDVAGVMIVDQDVPLRSGQLAAAGPHRTGGIDMAFAPCLPVHVGAGIDRIGQLLVDRGVRRRVLNSEKNIRLRFAAALPQPQMVMVFGMS